jgi:alpha-glucosidase
MVDFHGCSKPTGMQRMYPNIVNYEAVRGAECSKWDLTANPGYHLTFPFLRMLAGSLDYTPGSMRNRTQQMFKPLDPGMPLTQGTRCHELAMYVVFDQYLAMLCDSPTEYEKNSDIMRFLANVPVTFNDTKILSAKMGAFALVAKRKNSDWYIGGMTDWTARETEINFNFLKPGVKYMAEIYSDSNDSNTYADHFTFESLEVDSSTVIRVKMASGGGVALHTYPIQLSKAEK